MTNKHSGYSYYQVPKEGHNLCFQENGTPQQVDSSNNSSSYSQLSK